jgi:hypothetical protein
MPDHIEPPLCYNGRPLTHRTHDGRTPGDVAYELVSSGGSRVTLEPGDVTRYDLDLLLLPFGGTLTLLVVRRIGRNGPIVGVAEVVNGAGHHDMSMICEKNEWTRTLLHWWVVQQVWPLVQEGVGAR